MKRTNITLPEVEKMYDATLLEILPDYGFGARNLPHAVVTEGGKTGVSPCITSIGVTELMHPDMMIEIEATAVFD